MKQLSIITICYNEENLEATCESIVKQTWQNFEWIVIDGGSKPEILKIFDKYKNNIDIFISEKDGGIYNAMNKGISLASGKYLNFMNAGDSLYNNFVLEKIFNYKEYDYDILCGNTNYILNDGASKISVLSKNPTQFFKNKKTICHQSMFIKQNLFKKYGYYDERYKISSDFERWVCFYVNNCSFYVLKDIIVSTFKGNGLTSRNRDLDSVEKEEIVKKYNLL